MNRLLHLALQTGNTASTTKVVDRIQNLWHCIFQAEHLLIFRGLDSRCLQSIHIFLLFTGAFQHRQTEAIYFETDKIPLTVSSPMVISFAMQPSNNSQPNRRNPSHVGRCPLSAPSVFHSDIPLTRPPSSPLFVAKGHPQPWKLRIPIFWHHCLNSPFILSWLLLGINTISYKISPSISESVCRNQTAFLLCCFHKNLLFFSFSSAPLIDCKTRNSCSLKTAYLQIRNATHLLLR